MRPIPRLDTAPLYGCDSVIDVWPGAGGRLALVREGMVQRGALGTGGPETWTMPASHTI